MDLDAERDDKAVTSSALPGLFKGQPGEGHLDFATWLCDVANSTYSTVGRCDHALSWIVSIEMHTYSLI